jgi:hypothetical protein
MATECEHQFPTCCHGTEPTPADGHVPMKFSKVNGGGVLRWGQKPSGRRVRFCSRHGVPVVVTAAQCRECRQLATGGEERG